MPDKVTNTLSDEKIQGYIDGIYKGDITAENLPLDVYEAIVKYLKEGLYEGYGMTIEEATGADLELLTALRENVYMFGAAKTYQMTKDISSLLFDEDGNLRTNNEFNDIARESYDNWNDNWGETEYSTAVGQGYAAVKWNSIESEKEALPNLRYSAIGDACEICEPLDGLTAPVDDPVWDTLGPAQHFNCRCVLLQEDATIELTNDESKKELYDNAMDKMSPIFQSNSGKDGMVFNENHPYFSEIPNEDRAFARRNFDLPIPKKD